MSTTSPPITVPRTGMPALAVFAFLVALYSLTAHWSLAEQNVDTVATTLPAWHLVTEGDLDLPDFASVNPWILETQRGSWTNRPPGLILTAALGQAAALPFTVAFTAIPGTVLSVLLSAGAVTLIGLEADRRLGRRPAVLTVVALGIASATWPQASSEFFPHALGQFLMAATVVLVSRDRFWLAGSVLGFAVTVRPPLAVVALVLGIGLGLAARDWRPITKIGVPSLAGLMVLIAYNRFVFGAFSVSGGYGDFFDNGATYRTISGYTSNLIGGFLDPSNGLLAWSPWIAVALLGLFVRRVRIDQAWIVASAAAALAYVLVHAGLNRYWGGLAFNYRYPLEPLVLAMPLLATAMTGMTKQRLWRMALVTGLGVAIILQATVAFFLTCTDAGDVAVCTLL